MPAKPAQPSPAQREREAWRGNNEYIDPHGGFGGFFFPKLVFLLGLRLFFFFSFLGEGMGGGKHGSSF